MIRVHDVFDLRDLHDLPGANLTSTSKTVLKLSSQSRLDGADHAIHLPSDLLSA